MSNNPKRLIKQYSISIISTIEASFRNSIGNEITSAFLTKYQMLFKDISELKNFGMTFPSTMCFCFRIIRQSAALR